MKGNCPRFGFEQEKTTVIAQENVEETDGNYQIRIKLWFDMFCTCSSQTSSARLAANMGMKIIEQDLQQQVL